MAFLDNSGDIILDAVLTDTGRLRLARGDGSFRIVKFALGDDEINYARFDPAQPTGYEDLEILQTPVLEAFTNNASSMMSKLLTIPRDNIFFLPIMKLNNVFTNATKLHDSGAFLIAVDNATEQEFAVDSSGVSINGVLFGENPIGGGNYVRVDQGLDTAQISPARTLDPLLVETNYMIEIDNRLGSIVASDDGNAMPAPLAYIDDDMIATYSVSLGVDTMFVFENQDTLSNNSNQVIRGPRGTYLDFKILSSLEVNTSTYLFDTLGRTESLTGKNGSVSVRAIDTIVSITGGTTGFKLDIPVKFIKKV